MFDRESRPPLWRVGRRLWRVGRRFYIARTDTPIVEGLGLESALESADYSSELVDSNADLPKIGVCVPAFSVWGVQLCPGGQCLGGTCLRGYVVYMPMTNHVFYHIIEVIIYFKT